MACFGISIIIFICLTAESYGSTRSVLWSKSNCNDALTPAGDKLYPGAVLGKVTDAICCKGGTDHYCSNRTDRTSCNAEDTCTWKNGACVINRDAKNNVCCQRTDIKENCEKMMNGQCPTPWQIPTECCPAPYNKYSVPIKFLTTASDDLVCCNAPCTAIEEAWKGVNGTEGKSQCTAMLSENCAPAKRTYMGSMINQYGGMAMGGNYGGMMGGMYGGMGGLGGGIGGLGGLGGGMGGDALADQLSMLMGMPVSKPNGLGKVVGGMGGGMDGASLAALEALGHGSSRDDHVDEITVDDFFDAIIESLDNDKDVFEYNKEINSDSWFGKQSFGGLVDGFNFIDPTKFINQIYGSQFGLSNAQAMYGMQYGISQDKFKTPAQHQMMTGFGPPSPYPTSGYNSQPSYGPSPYASTSAYGPPSPPQWAPPSPPQWAPPSPPQWAPSSPPQNAPPSLPQWAPPSPPQWAQPSPPAQPGTPEQVEQPQSSDNSSPDAPAYPEQPSSTYPEQPQQPYPEQSQPSYPQQQQPVYPEPAQPYNPYPEQQPSHGQWNQQPANTWEQQPPPSSPWEQAHQPASSWGQSSGYGSLPGYTAPESGYGQGSGYSAPGYNMASYGYQPSYPAQPSYDHNPSYPSSSGYGSPPSYGAAPAYPQSESTYGSAGPGWYQPQPATQPPTYQSYPSQPPAVPAQYPSTPEEPAAV